MSIHNHRGGNKNMKIDAYAKKYITAIAFAITTNEMETGKNLAEVINKIYQDGTGKNLAEVINKIYQDGYEDGANSIPFNKDN